MSYHSVQLRVDIPANDDIPEIRPHYPGTPLNPPVAATLPYPIILHPRQKSSFFIPPEFFDPMHMLKNPMILMMGATALMAIGLPWMLVSTFDQFPNCVDLPL
jgi:hypothetical protein